MTLRKLTAAVAFTLAAGMALPAAASAGDRYDRDRDRGRYDRGRYDRSYRSYDRGYRSYNRGYRPYRVYRPAPRYYYDPYVYGYYVPDYRPYRYSRPYRYYDRGPRIHLHLDF
jgi:hypothetical protein